MVQMWSEDELKCGWVGLHGGLINSGVPLAQFVSHSFWVHFGINFQLEALQNASEEQAEALQLGY